MNWKLKYGLVAVVISIVMIFLGGADAFSFMKDPIQVKTGDDVRNLKDGQHVQFDITMCYGCLISEITTTTKNGTKTSEKETSRYYLIPYLTNTDKPGYEEFDYFLTVKLNSDNFSKAEQAMTAFEQFWENIDLPIPSTSFITVDGIVTKMKDEEKSYVDKFNGSGQKYVDYIYVKTPDKTTAFVILAIGGVFLLAGILFLVFFFLGLKKDKARQAEFKAANPNYYQAPAGVSFNNDANGAPTNPYAFDPSKDPRFTGVASGNPTGTTGQYGAQPQNENFNEVLPTQSQYVSELNNSGNFNEVPNNDQFNNQQ